MTHTASKKKRRTWLWLALLCGGLLLAFVWIGARATTGEAQPPAVLQVVEQEAPPNLSGEKPAEWGLPKLRR